MNLDNDELEIALIAFRHLRNSAKNQRDGHAAQVTGAAWWGCDHLIGKADALIARVEQHQKDVENGDA